MSTVTIFCREGACNVENHTRDNCPNKRESLAGARILEALCGRCGETFVPDAPTDLEHLECGGSGEIVGQYR